MRWMSQVEGEVFSIKESVSTVSAKVDGLAASFASLEDVVAAASAQVSHLEIAMQQFIDNQVAQGGPSRQGDDARELLLQNRSLAKTLQHGRSPTLANIGSFAVVFRPTLVRLLRTSRLSWGRVYT